MRHDEVKPMLNEIFDITVRQREILTDLENLVYNADRNEKVLEALENCLKSLDAQEENYKQLFKEFEKAAYSQAVNYFNV